MYFFALLGTLCLFAGCFKDFKDEYLFTKFMVEFDASSWESNIPGKSYPVIGPVEKGSGVHTYQVNLIGAVMESDQQVRYRVVPEETTATEGLHFRLADSGIIDIGANSTNGVVSIEVLDFPSEAGVDTVVIELIGNELVGVSENYKRLAVAITLTGPPSADYPLYQQLSPENFYNSIYLDPLNLDLPVDIRRRLSECADNLASFADGSRRLQGMYLYFDNNQLVHVVAQYYGGGGNSLTAGPTAIWTYKMALDDNGVSKMTFVEANGNGNGQYSNFSPILADYLERHEFKVDWVDPAVVVAPQGRQLGGLFRTDDPSSFLFGTLETLSATGTIKPKPYAQSVHEIFDNGNGGHYTSLLINPADPAQSEGFRIRWEEGKSVVESAAGRQLHQLMLYFNPTFNFQDVRIVTYYYSATGGKFMGQVRCQYQVDSKGVVMPFGFVYQDGNGAATRTSQVLDDFLMAHNFTMSRTGTQVRFTSVDDPSVYVEGQLGDRPVNVGEFWPE